MTATPSFPRTVLLAAAAAAALGSFAVLPAFAQTDPAPTGGDTIREAEISTIPLYSETAGDKPTMLLAPSIEFPTVGAQYRGTDDYSPDEEYIGYYNAEKCYVYDYDPDDDGDDDDDDDDDEDDDDIKDQGYFRISGNATGRKCSGNTFSGNFLNWASSSAMDIMRLALTGGDRILDMPNETILQRAYLPNGTANVTVNGQNRGPGCFFNNGGQFPGKVLTLDKAAGAVPAIMIEQARAQGPSYASIHIGNMGNRIYFGLFQSEAQNCTSGPQTYTLGTGRDAPSPSYNRNLSLKLPPGFPGAPTQTGAHGIFTHYCTEMQGGCYPGGGKNYTVWYGSVDGGWTIAEVGPGDGYNGAFKCTNRAHGSDSYAPQGVSGGYRFSSNNPTEFPTPAAEIPNRGCWLTERTTPAKGDRKYALNSKGYFLARVKVCDANDERDYTMCTEYPNGKKKPTGVIQRHADNLRFAAFGYAIDQTASHNTDNYKGRFGALLRAPMKYVGPNTYTHTGVRKDEINPKAEWDNQNGMLIRDPDGVGATSGVINYFNRFGRNPKKKGNYKQYDNVGEMYYEALRYLQGLSPSPAAVSNITQDMRDGMPAYTSWGELDPFGTALGYREKDPNTGEKIDYSCLKNSLLVIGDINTHDPVNGDKDKLREGMADKDESKNQIDIDKWRKVVRAFETKSGSPGTYKDGQGNNRNISNPNSAEFSETGIGGGDGWRNINSFIPGMAYWAHTHDIRGANWTNGSNIGTVSSKVRHGLRITSYFFDVNENKMSEQYDARTGKQGVKSDGNGTLGGAYHGNQYWLAAKYGGFLTSPKSEECTETTNAAGNKVQTCVGVYSATGNPFYSTRKITVTDKDTGAKTTTYENLAATNDVWADPSKVQGTNPDGKPEPRTYYMPSNARGVLKAFEDIFGDQDLPSNRSIAGADSSGGLDSRSFQAMFDGSDWSGDVIAEKVVVCPTDGSLCPRDELRAAAKLEGKSATRNIIMASHGDDGATTAFEFKGGSVPEEVTAALTAGGCTNTADCINWLRGDHSKEKQNGGALRNRAEGRLLGDIINSGVKYVGAPAGQVNLGLGYDEFVDSKAFRTAAVYVGANDGMLHAFHAGGKEEVAGSDGRTTVRDAEPTLEELFAYIPSWMKGKLADLTSPTYTHQAYVDATPVIGDANLKADCTATTVAGATTNDCDWRSVLVGGTGGGGKGVYALDVTDPDNFTTESVLWEFTDADDPDMGYVLGQARIVKLLFTPANTTATPPTPAVYRWFAMVPAGVNNYVGDDTARRGNGDANIFLLALDKAADAAWAQGTNYWKLRLPRIQALQGTHPTGILNLEAFTGLGGVTEYVYAGDLHGQLWAFKFKDIDSTGWNTATLANCYSSGSCQEGAVKPLYIAENAAGDAQPITVAPTILEGAGNGVHFVSFGTGKYFEPTDAQAGKIDSFYTVYSNFNHSAAQILSRDSGDAIIPGRNYLQKVEKDRTEDGVDYFKPSQAFFWGWLASAPTDADTNPTRSGWYLDFAANGERQIADASWVSLTSRLMFSTLTPNSATNTGVCGTGGGDSKLYTFDMISGMGTGRASGVGMLAQPLVFLDTTNTTETQADSTGRRLRISPVMSGQFGSDGSSVEQVDTVIVPFGRLSWRRVDNFQGLKNQSGTSNPGAGGGGTGGGGSGDSN